MMFLNRFVYKIFFLSFCALFFFSKTFGQTHLQLQKIISIDSVSKRINGLSQVSKSDTSVIGNFPDGKPISRVIVTYYKSESNVLSKVDWISEFHIRKGQRETMPINQFTFYYVNSEVVKVLHTLTEEKKKSKISSFYYEQDSLLNAANVKEAATALNDGKDFLNKYTSQGSK
jgi:hypothetical protein